MNSSIDTRHSACGVSHFTFPLCVRRSVLARRRASGAYCVGGSAVSSIASPYAGPHAHVQKRRKPRAAQETDRTALVAA